MGDVSAAISTTCLTSVLGFAPVNAVVVDESTHVSTIFLRVGANRCSSGGFTGPDEQPPITAYQALEQIASGPDAFYNQPSAGDLSAIFVSIAGDISRGNGALVDNSASRG